MPDDASTSWREERRAAAAHQHAQLLRRQAQETAQARILIASFLTEARRCGLEPVPLRVKATSGRATYRTTLQGWYLKANRSVAIDTQGQFYVLTVPARWLSRWTGAQPHPSDPPLVLGAGGRDGESVDLAQALRRTLNAS